MSLRLLIHQMTCRCHICGKASSGPKSYQPYRTGTTAGMGGGPYTYRQSTSEEKVEWSEPTNLWRCKRCGKWTCYDHFVPKGTGSLCAECSKG
ncbi:MAG: hypothetical protein UU41_C0037G0005 [Candidatus Roizmanbacteria bacterium GW2011_GWA1_41_13]|uniref:Uncharacterized protein n=1 Tax=Candidatus Roizmanbacteria bacterium GW2011_GWA1_41_13 TaxID=1618474 RepID=A0A0G0X435_9BACT|nr:MAG: hypothetical protein UU41_C0037G0005 [Candidatus Roizmanbacteria bacterium GW2011_GWA1_41_13]